MRVWNEHIRIGRLWILGLLASLTLAAGAVPAAAQGSNLRPGESSDDETIGTLPSTQGTSAIHIVRAVHDARPSLYVAGPAEDLFNALLAADSLGGPAAATVTDLGAGRIRITFYGSVRVLLDRATIDLATSATIGLSSQHWQTAATRLAFGSRAADLGGLAAGPTELPVVALSRSGLLDANRLGAATRLAETRLVQQTFAASGNLLILTQAH